MRSGFAPSETLFSDALQPSSLLAMVPREIVFEAEERSRDPTCVATIGSFVQRQSLCHQFAQEHNRSIVQDHDLDLAVHSSLGLPSEFQDVDILAHYGNVQIGLFGGLFSGHRTENQGQLKAREFLPDAC